MNYSSYFYFPSIIVSRFLVTPPIFFVSVTCWHSVISESAAICYHFPSGRLRRIRESQVAHIFCKDEVSTHHGELGLRIRLWCRAQPIPLCVREKEKEWRGGWVCVCQTNGPLSSVRVYLAGRSCGSVGFGVQTRLYFYLGRKGAHYPLCCMFTQFCIHFASNMEAYLLLRIQILGVQVGSDSKRFMSQEGLQETPACTYKHTVAI